MANLMDYAKCTIKMEKLSLKKRNYTNSILSSGLEKEYIMNGTLKQKEKL
jgi:hypothetical protein